MTYDSLDKIKETVIKFRDTANEYQWHIRKVFIDQIVLRDIEIERLNKEIDRLNKLLAVRSKKPI